MKNMGEVFQLSQGCSAAVRHGAPCGSFYAEKAAAAAACGATLIVLRRPADSGEDFETILQFCREMLA